MGSRRRRNIIRDIILKSEIWSQMWVPLRVVCPSAMGSRRRRNIVRGIILKSWKKSDQQIAGDIFIQLLQIHWNWNYWEGVRGVHIHQVYAMYKGSQHKLLVQPWIYSSATDFLYEISIWIVSDTNLLAWRKKSVWRSVISQKGAFTSAKISASLSDRDGACYWVSVNLSDALGDKLDFIVTQFNEGSRTAGESHNFDTHVLVLELSTN